MNLNEAQAALDKVINKARVHLYKPIQIAEVLYRDRVEKDIQLNQLDTYRTASRKWRDIVCLQFLGRTSTSSARYQDDIFNDNAIPPLALETLAKENRAKNGAIEAYIYQRFAERFTQMSTGLAYCDTHDRSNFLLSEFIDMFWKEAGLKRSIDKVYEIVVFSLFSALVEALELSIEVSFNPEKQAVLDEFKDFAQKVINLSNEQTHFKTTAKIFRGGVTNAADRGLDMWANFGLAIQIKHLSLSEEVAQDIVHSITADRIVIVCKAAEQKIITSLINQLGWKSRIQSVVTENDLNDWYEKALRGAFGEQIGNNVLTILSNEIKIEFPVTEVTEFKQFLKNRGYDKFPKNVLSQIKDMASYKEYKGLNLPEIDKDIQHFWDTEGVFEKSVAQRDPQNAFVFYEGPPSANGLPGIHHVMARTIKDIFCRFQTLNGKRVERKGGWDTHGLPIELAVEKELGITKEDIGKKISVDDYNHKCREVVMRYKDLWDDITRKMGYWVDLDNPYITYENAYIESVWFLLKRLYDKGYLYKGYTIQPYSPAAGTGLSSHELNMPGTYKDVTDTTVVAMFKVSPPTPKGGERDWSWLFDNADEDVRIIAWTTTPWTLPSNTALTVGPNIDYVKIKTKNPYTHAEVSVVLAEKLVSKWFGGKNQPTIEAQSAPFKGEVLRGVRYEQLFNYGNEIQELNGKTDAFRVITGDFVTTEDGTGVVHTAPSFGAEDMKVGRENGIGALTLVDKQGKFTDNVGEFSNRYVKNYKDDPDYVDVNVDISVKLKLEGYAFRVEKYVHPYPHCWRTDKPVLYYPLDSWFIAASKSKERMYELNKTINWKPAATGEGRFGKWLENLQDWNLSRSRYWGIGLPIWRTENTEGSQMVEKCIGSIAELQFEINKANDVLGLNQTVPADLHRPYIDDITLVTLDGRPMKRELDLIDVWFDSGSMPYAQWGLDQEKLIAGDEMPFKNPFNVSYPADFIAEGVDQTRGWFYTLHAIAVMAYDSVAFKNVVSNGLVQDKNGQKMSKSKGNAVEPFETIAKYGADATRWYMISNAQPWDNLKFDENGITETRNKFFGTLYNSYNFFAMYANVDGFVQDEMNQTPMENRIELDKWILSKLHSLVADVTELYATYEPTLAARAIEKFVDADFSNWYVRLSRRRFWKGEMSDDKKAAYETMYQCLMVTAQLSAPIAPYFSDWMYKNLTDNIRSKAVENNTPLRHPSVHLSDLTKSDKWLIDKDLEQRMDYAQRISSLILSLRKKAKIRVRQPLQKAMLPILDANFIQQVEGVKDLVLAETNVKVFEYITDTSGVVKKRIKPNFKTLGKILGGNMKFAQSAIEALTQDDIATLERDKVLTININGQEYPLSIDDFLITSEDIPGWEVASDGDVTVALDITLNDALIAEGTARDLVNKIQNIRKDKNFDITDRIAVKIEKHAAILEAVTSFSDYIKSEVLADSFVLVDSLSVEKTELNDAVALGIEVNLN